LRGVRRQRDPARGHGFGHRGHPLGLGCDARCGQDAVALLGQARRRAIWPEPHRRLRDRNEGCGFRKIKGNRTFGEPRVRTRSHPFEVAAHRGKGQVEAEDFPLAEAPL
jgi:hypothetical protein